MHGAFMSSSMWKSVQWSPPSSAPAVSATKAISAHGARLMKPPGARSARTPRAALTAAPAPTLAGAPRPDGDNDREEAPVHQVGEPDVDPAERRPAARQPRLVGRVVA